MPHESPQRAPGDATAPHDPASAQRKPASGFALTALILGIAAFVLMWIPAVGALIAIPGLVFGILALLRQQPSGKTVTGVVLSGIALLASVTMTATMLAEFPG